MLLSSVMGFAGRCELAADGAFETLGKLNALSGLPTLVFAGEAAFLSKSLAEPSVTAVVTNRESLAATQPDERVGKGILVAESPREAFFQIHLGLVESGGYQAHFESRISPGARIAPSARIAPRNVVIEDGCVIGENVVIHEGVEIAAGANVGAGCVLGQDGFEVSTLNGRPKLIPHGGRLLIGREAYLKCGICVSRGLFPGRNTIIGEQVFIDDLVMVAHGVQIGAGSKVAGKAVIAGNVTIENGVWIGPGATISNGLTIGAGATVSLGSTVVSGVKKGQRVTGYFAVEHNKFMAYFAQLLKMAR